MIANLPKTLSEGSGALLFLSERPERIRSAQSVLPGQGQLLKLHLRALHATRVLGFSNMYCIYACSSQLHWQHLLHDGNGYITAAVVTVARLVSRN
jgi:hypothetical protein